MGVCSLIHLKLGVPEIKMVKITARAVKLFYLRVSGISLQMGVHGLVSVNLGVLDME